MAELPRGTVTFLFTDIEGSTQRWERDRVAMRKAIEHHLTLLASVVETHNGVLFKVMGDSVQAAFSSAPDAVAAALDAQQALLSCDWSAVGGLPVRMALHVGEAVPDDRDDYLAAPLNRLSRLLAVGHGGQILLTQAVQQLCRGALPPGLALQDLGEHRLRDLQEPERVFQLLHPMLPSAFPPLTTLDARPNNLPRQPAPLIGREQEVSQVVALLRRKDVQLVTLTGPGGTGKTRLAVHIGAEVLDQFPDGVWFVDLASIRDAALVLSTVASVLGLRDAGETPLGDRLVALVRDQYLMLILDNCEHLLAAAPEIGALLAACQHLTLLSTSREAWHLRAEQEVPIAPLPVPDYQPTASLGAIAQVPSVALFVQRATAANPRFALTSDNVQAVAAICRQLDGLPLAIELAAARTKLLPPAALLQRLERRLPLLTSGARDAPARQRTLRDTMAWSHELLRPDEQRLFRRLSVFAGGWTLDAAENITNPDGDIDVLDNLASLVDKSLIRQGDETQGEPQFGMFETVREFALEQLTMSGEATVIRDRHAAWCLTLAEQAEPALFQQTDHGSWLVRLTAEHDNLRAALAWLTESAGTETGLRLSGALWWFWYLRGHWSEGCRWLTSALAQNPGAPAAPRAKALIGVATLAHFQGDLKQAISAGREGLRLWREVGDQWGTGYALLMLGVMAEDRGDYDAAVPLLEGALRLFQDLEYPALTALTLHHLGVVAQGQRTFERATALLKEALARSQERGDPWGAAINLLHLGLVAAEQRDVVHASRYYAECLALYQEAGATEGIAQSLASVAALAAEHEQPERAARLLGTAEALSEILGYRFALPERATYERARRMVQTVLDEPSLAAAWAAGRSMRPDQAIAETTEVLRSIGVTDVA
jgi:predicted ATPase/class 3 adenylate cyclase